MTVKDYYQILGVEIDSSTDDIKKAYRRLAKNYHPDAQPNNHSSDNHDKFKEITEAYQVLKDPEKRKKYDQMNAIGNGVSGVYQPFDPNGGEEEVRRDEEAVWEEVFDPVCEEPFPRDEEIRSSESSGQSSQGEQSSQSGKKSAGDPESPGKQDSREAPENGKIVEMEVSFELAVKGGSQSLTIPGEEKCEKCGGTGARSKKDVTICRGCEGSGIILSTRLASAEGDECPMCKGKGKLIKGRCSRCKGDGMSRKDVKVSVNVPAGIEYGTRMRLNKLLGPEEQGNWDGMWIEFKVKSHPFFRRSGLDILCESPIGIDKAILGGTISVKTALGKRVSIKIPPGTDSGTIFRIRNEGITIDGRRGHQLVKVKIITPKHLSNKAREHLNQFLRETQSKLR